MLDSQFNMGYRRRLQTEFDKISDKICKDRNVIEMYHLPNYGWTWWK